MAQELLLGDCFFCRVAAYLNTAFDFHPGFEKILPVNLFGRRHSGKFCSAQSLWP